MMVTTGQNRREERNGENLTDDPRLQQNKRKKCQNSKIFIVSNALENILPKEWTEKKLIQAVLG